MSRQWAGKRVLITGITGFIGTKLAKHLVGEGARVSGLSRNASSTHGDLSCYACNAGSIDDLRGVFEIVQPDLVYHLSSYVSGSRDADLVLPTLHNNLVSAVNVLTCCVERGHCRVVMAGSLEEPDANYPVPVSPYAAAKGASTAYALVFHELYDLPVTIARIFMVYGPGQPNLKMLVPYSVLSLLRDESPRLSSGRRMVDWIYIDDVVEGLIRSGSSKESIGAVVDIGSGELQSVREVVDHIATQIESTGVPAFGALPDGPRERVVTARVDESRRLLRWEPSVSLDEGLGRTVEWARKLLLQE